MLSQSWIMLVVILCSGSNAARERSRVRTLRAAFLDLQRTLPAVPRDTKLSKLDVLVLATTYIAQLTSTLTKTKGSTTTCHQPLPGSDVKESKMAKVDDEGEISPQLSKQTRTTALEQEHQRQQQHHNYHSCTRTRDSAVSVPLVPDPQLRRRGRGRGSADDGDATVAAAAFRKEENPSGLECSVGGRGTKDHEVVSRLRSHGYLHPVKKWPMRTRLYAGIMASASGVKVKKTTSITSLE